MNPFRSARPDGDDRDPIRVAMIGQYGIPAAYGGVERVVEELGAELAERGVEVTVYCSRTDPPPPETYRGMRLRTVRELGGKHSAKLTQSGFAALDAVRRDYDIVHFHATGPCLFTPLVRLLRPRLRVVATIHARDEKRSKWSRSAQRVLRLAAWCAAKVPHRVMVVSEDLRRSVALDYGTDCTVVHNGFAPAPARGEFAELAAWGLEPGRYLLTVGRLVPEKAVDDLITAFRDSDTDWKLVVVGDSSHTDAFVRQVNDAVGDDPRIILTGPVFGAPLDALYRYSGGFALPSRLEGLPVVLLEAVGYDLPLIVSDIAPNLEVVGGDGPGHRVVPVGDVASFTTAINRLVDGPDSERRLDPAFRTGVLAEFDWSRAADTTLGVYREVTGQSTERPSLSGASATSASSSATSLPAADVA